VTDENPKNANAISACDGVTDGNPLSVEKAYVDLAPEKETAL